MRILIAEDEPEVAKALKIMLERSHFAVDAVDNGRDALDYLTRGKYDVAVLDIMMPKMDGLEVLRRIRAQGHSLPVLLLTAKSEIEDRVIGLDAGADDYLTKPFAGSEFVARVKALARRAQSFIPQVITLGNLSLDCNSFLLSGPSGSIRLNNKEFQMMELFLRNPRNIFSASCLMERVWGYDSESGMDVVWTYIAFLRKKLKHLESNVQLCTVRGAGYTLEESRPRI